MRVIPQSFERLQLALAASAVLAFALPSRSLATETPAAIDLSFAAVGLDSVVRVVALEPDGKILIGGAFTHVDTATRTGVARLTAGGEVDASFDSAGLVGEVLALGRQSDGRVVVGGSFSTSNGLQNIARLNPTGNLDNTFNPAGGANGAVWAVAIQDNGQIVIGGDFTNVNGLARSRLARLNSNGVVDGGFDLAINGVLRSVKVLGNQQLLVAGNFTTINGVSRNRIARLNSDGTLDLSFNPGGGADSWVSAVAVQPDGRILIGGGFTTFDGETRRRIARLENNGALDRTFDPGLGANDSIGSIALETDGKIVIGGGFTEVDGAPRMRVARFYPNGIVDSFFVPTPGANDWVESVAIQSDGRILIGGAFIEYNQSTRHRLVRLQGGDPPSSGPVFNGSPATLTVDAGVNLTLQAGATAWPPPSYRWFFNGTEIVGATRETLRLRNVQTGDAGNYSVTVSNALGVDSRQVASISVAAAPAESGAPDIRFYAGTGPDQVVYALAVQADRKVLVGGSFATVDGVLHGGVARLEENGAVDQSFHAAATGIVRSVALEQSGKILIGGAFRGADLSMLLLVAQLTGNGDFDPAFQPLRGSGFISKIIVLPNQKLLVGGPFGITEGGRRALALLQPNGAVDTSFNVPFSAGAAVYAMSREADDQIVIGGLFSSIGGVPRNNIARINQDGSVDPSFNPGAGTNGSIRAMALQSDGKFIVAGRFTRVSGIPRLRLARLHGDGSLDLSFDAGLVAIEDDITSLAVQNDGKILIGTTFDDGDFAIARLHTDGSLDGTFRTVPFPNRGSFGPSGGVESIEVLSDGNVLIGGRFQTVNNIPRPNVARLIGGDPPAAAPTILRSPIDRTVTAGANVTFEVVASSVPVPSYQWQYNGNDLPGENRWNLTLRNVRQTNSGTYTVVVRNALGFAMSAPATLTVLMPPGNPGAADIGFYTGLGPNERVEAVLVQSDSKIVIAGLFTEVAGTNRNRIARLNRTGSVDLSFTPGLGADNAVSALALQPDGKIVIGGSFTSFNGVARARLARLNSDGTLDETFNATVDGNVAVLALQPNGAILVGGAFTLVNGTARIGLVRLSSNGSLDTTFAPAFSNNPVVAALALQLDNAILAGGLFSYADGLRQNLARFQPGGAVDDSFDVDGGPSHRVNAIALQPDGRILIGGLFTAFAGVNSRYLVRLDQNGAIDASFAPQLDGPVAAIAVQQNSKILIGGIFTSASNLSRLRLARLNSDGSVDSTFDVGAGIAGGTPFLNEYGEYGDILEQAAVSALALEGQNTAVIAGNFSTVNNAARPYVARVYLRDAATIDTDADGLPDWWEQQYGLDAYTSTGVHGGTGDFDGDGRSNRIEFINGTNPVRADSIEPQVTIAQISPGVRTLRFATLRDRTYRIFFTNDLTQPFTVIVPPIVGTGGVVTWTDDGSQTGGAAPNRFYKVEIELTSP